MNTLNDLNIYSSETVSVTDDRNYAVVFDAVAASDQSISVALNQAHIVRLGNDIFEIINPPSGLTFTIDVGVSGATVAWLSSTPSGVTLDTSVAGVYTLSGIETIEHWNFARSAVITPELDSSTQFDYVCTIGFPEYNSETERTWTTTTTITALGSYTSLSDIDFDPGYPSPVTSYPTVVTSGVTSRFRVTIEATELSNMTSTGTGSASFASGVYTITGTKTQVNTRLRSLVLTSSSTSDFIMTYLVQNLETGVLSYYQQNVVKDLANAETTNLGINRTYTENTVGLLFTDNYPDNIESDSGENQYTISITLSDAIGKITLENDDYPLDWNKETRTWSITGTKTECNAALRSLYFMPKRNTSSTTSITFRQYKGTLLQTSDTVSLVGAVRTTAIPGAGVYAFKQSGTLELTYDQAYYLNCDILVVAGGGAGGSGEYLDNSNIHLGGGGGAGGAKYIQNYTGFEVLKYNNDTTSFNITVGEGGQPGTYNTQGLNGGDTTITFLDNGYYGLSSGAGDYGVLVTTKDQQLVGWGLNNGGQLGAGDLDIRTSISNLNTDPVWIQTSMSDTNGARLNEDGEVWMSGENGWGQLGIGTTGGLSKINVKISGLYTGVSLGYGYGLAVTTTGQIKSWGLNNKGQLGLSNTVNKSVPTTVGTDTDWTTVSAGYENALAIKSTGTLWRWGSNTTTPTQVGTATNWTKVFDGYFAINNLGELYKIVADTATKIGSATNWVKACYAGLNRHNVALNSAGEIYTWGLNNAGQLALGDTSDRTNPTLVAGGPWTDIGVSPDNTYAINTLGEVYSCGNPAGAGLGDGTTSGSNVTTLTKISTSLLHMYGGGAGGITYYNGSAWVGVTGQNNVADDGVFTGSGGGGYGYIWAGSALNNGGVGTLGQGSGGRDGFYNTQTVNGYTYIEGPAVGGGVSGTVLDPVDPTHGANATGASFVDEDLAREIYPEYYSGIIRYAYGGPNPYGTMETDYYWGTGGAPRLLDHTTHEVIGNLANVPTADPDDISTTQQAGTQGIVLIKFYE